MTPDPLPPDEPAPGAATTRIRVMCVDDHAMLREGIAGVLQGQPDLQLVAEAATGTEAIALFRIHRPDVTLMDIQMPGISGIEAVSAIRAEFPEARLIMLTTYKGDVQALRALQAGASGYLLKNMLRKEMLEAIRTVHAGRRYLPAEIAVELAEHMADEVLSAREIEVLRLVAAGSSNKRVAAALALSEDTVKAHMKHVLAKLKATDRTHAVTIALRRGIIEL